jgi:hypothetical protein
MGNPYASEKGRSGGGGRVFNFGDTKVKYLKIDKDGEYAIDIIPMEITTKNNPSVVDGSMKIGDKIHALDYFVHKNIGPKKQAYICPSQTVGKACPICEEYDRVKKAKGWDSDEAKALKATHRIIYNVVNADDEKGTVMLFDASYYLFAAELNEEAETTARKRNVDFLDYAGIFSKKDALSISFRAVMTKSPVGEYAKFKSFAFEERKNQFTGKAISVDNFMIVKSYDELSNIFFGGGDDEVIENSEPEEQTEKEEVRETRKPKEEDDVKTCPSKLKFGVDFDSDKSCDTCEVYSDCKTEFRRLKRQS